MKFKRTISTVKPRGKKLFYSEIERPRAEMVSTNSVTHLSENGVQTLCGCPITEAWEKVYTARRCQNCERIAQQQRITGWPE